jgi:predicted secreted protein
MWHSTRRSISRRAADRGRRAQALRDRRTSRFGSGFRRFAQALTTAVDMAARAYQRDGKLSGLATS